MGNKTKNRVSLLLAATLAVSSAMTACGIYDSKEARTEAPHSGEGGETMQELYEKALQEDTMILYTNTTRVFETKAAFEEEYPGLSVEIHDLRPNDIVGVVTAAGLAGEYVCDVVMCTDINGDLSQRLVPEGIIYKYVPPGVADVLLPEYEGELLYFVGEGVQIFYNSDASDEPPISNWWQLTEPQFTSNVYLIDPYRSYTSSVLLCSFIQHSDEMAQAYYEYYGKELSVPEGSTAGEEFWKQVLANDMQFTSSSDEAITFLASAKGDANTVAIAVSSKLRMVDIGFPIEPVFGMSPASGVHCPNSVMLSRDGKNPSTARLFVWFLLGGEDGTGAGYKPYLQDGAWSVRSDVASATQLPLAETGFWDMDREYYAENCGWIMEFWNREKELAARRRSE